jgi:hypothetical protein
MLNRSIVHQCGHVETHSFEPGMFDRVSKAEIERRWDELAKQPCRSCKDRGRSDAPGAHAISDEESTVSDVRGMVRRYVNTAEGARYRNQGDVAAAIAAGASEFLEHYKSVTDVESEEKAGESVEMQADLAELITCCLVFANDLHMDIAKAVEEKVRPDVPRPPARLEKGDYTNMSNI